MPFSEVDINFLHCKDRGEMNLFITTDKVNMTEGVLAPGLNRVITFWRSNTFGRAEEGKKKHPSGGQTVVALHDNRTS